MDRDLWWVIKDHYLDSDHIIRTVLVSIFWTQPLSKICPENSTRVIQTPGQYQTDSSPSDSWSALGELSRQQKTNFLLG